MKYRATSDANFYPCIRLRNTLGNRGNALEGVVSLNQQLNKERSAMLNNWNKAADKFMDQHMPVQKRVK